MSHQHVLPCINTKRSIEWFEEGGSTVKVQGAGPCGTVRPFCQGQKWCNWSFRSRSRRGDSHSETPHSVIKTPGITLSNPKVLETDCPCNIGLSVLHRNADYPSTSFDHAFFFYTSNINPQSNCYIMPSPCCFQWSCPSWCPSIVDAWMSLANLHSKDGA